MANFAELTARLNLNIQDFATNLQVAAGMTNSFAKNINGKINTGMTEPAKNARTVFTDVKRIVQGILISQMFYQGMRSIKDATSATWEFAGSLEYAEIAYTNLFGNKELATEFINVLKDFAAVTPFGFTEAEKAAKRLLAYGIEYKNVMYVMQGILSASTMTGSAQTIESVSRALGQINTKGRLYNEEMRQLAEAGIPAYEILQEKLGLTQEQLKNLAKNVVPASVAINALVDGINERFGGVAAVSNLTMRGLFANLKDNLLMIGSEAIQPLFNKVKALLVPFVEFVTELRNIVDTQGIGGLFERLIPQEMQSTIKMFIANLMNLWTVIKINLTNVFKAFKIVLEAVIRVFNAFAPALTAVLDVVGRVTQAVLNNEKAVRLLTIALAAAAAMWVVFKLKAVASAVVAGIITGISKAVLGLSKVLTFVVAHPFWALMIGLVGVVVGLSGGFNKLGDAVNGFFKKLTQFNGVDPDKLLLPSQKERAADLEKFNQKLSGTGDAMDDLADKTGKATKAAKGLLSFDEVFKLNQPDEGTDDGAMDWGDFDFPDFGGMGEAIMPEIPDFKGFAVDFVDNLMGLLEDALGDKLKNLLSALLGAALGAALGALMGGPLGALIGGALGALAGWFWPMVAEALGLTDVGMIAIPLAAALGAAIGWLVGGPAGAAVGAAIGVLVGWLIDKIYKGISTGDWTGIGKPIGVGLGTAIGWLVGGPLGAFVGGAIGLLVGDVVDLIIDGFTNGNWNIGALATNIGVLLGAAIGFAVGGPGGAAIGAGIGVLVGYIVTLLERNWTSVTEWFILTLDSIGAMFSGIGTTISTALNTAWTAVRTSLKNLGGTFVNAFNEIHTTILTFFSNLWTTVSEWASKTFEPLTDALSNMFNVMGIILEDIWNAITTVWTDIIEATIVVGDTLYNTLYNAFSLIVEVVTFALETIWAKIEPFITSVILTISTFFSDVMTKLTTWITDITTKVSAWFTDLVGKITNWFNDIASKVKTFFASIITAMTTWFSEQMTKFTTFFANLLTLLIKYFGDILKQFQTLFSDVIGKVVTFSADTINLFTIIMSSLWTVIKTGTAQIYTTFTTWISNIWNNVFNKLFGWINDAINKLRDFLSLESRAKSASVPTTTSTNSVTVPVKKGHAIGGIFNREHIARFAEGNKAEAVIPLENASAMQPFVDAISNGIMQGMMPTMTAIVGNSNSTSNENLRPLYVGTLIADERSLRDLQRRMNVIQIQENTRRGE